MEFKFIVTFLIAFGFLGLYLLCRHREKCFERATPINGEVVEIFMLDREKPKFGFAIDRGEAFGNFIRIRYQHDNQEKTFESTLINNHYNLGQQVKIKRIGDEHIRICGEMNTDKKMTLCFLGAFFILLAAATFGVARPFIQ